MPARLSSMELSDPVTSESNLGPIDATNRRKSSRVRHKPVLLQDDHKISRSSNGTGKRKRGGTIQEGGTDADNISLDEASDSDGDPDEEELKEKKRKAPRVKKMPSKPAAKKPKTSDMRTASLPVRPAMNGVKKASKPKKPQAQSSGTVVKDATGLYGVFNWVSSALCRV